MNGAFVGVLLLFGFIALYFISFLANKKVEAPEGVERISKCSTCGTSGSCALKDTTQYKDTDEENCHLYEPN